jgi:hypothetical protein
MFMQRGGGGLRRPLLINCLSVGRTMPGERLHSADSVIN